MDEEKILILKGSPRPNGNSSALADRVAEGARSAGGLVESFLLQRMNILPCDGCRSCRGEIDSYCVIQDDMQILYPKLLEADAILIASPVYWFEVSAQTKAFIDRTYALDTNKEYAKLTGKKNLLSGKRFGLVLTYGNEDIFLSGAINPIRWFQDVCRYMNAELAGMVYGQASEIGEIQRQPGLMEKAFQLGQKMAG